jgi:hypothetical protein
MVRGKAMHAIETNQGNSTPHDQRQWESNYIAKYKKTGILIMEHGNRILLILLKLSLLLLGIICAIKLADTLIVATPGELQIGEENFLFLFLLLISATAFMTASGYLIIMETKAAAISELPHVIAGLENRASQFKRLYMQQKSIEDLHTENQLVVKQISKTVSDELQLIRTKSNQILELQGQLTTETKRKTSILERLKKIYRALYSEVDYPQSDDLRNKLTNFNDHVSHYLSEFDVQVINPKRLSDFIERKMQIVGDVMETDNEKLNDKVCECRTPGFEGPNPNDISKAEVTIWKFVQDEQQMEDQTSPENGDSSVTGPEQTTDPKSIEENKVEKSTDPQTHGEENQ